MSKMPRPRRVRLLHFNDVECIHGAHEQHVDEVEPIGGIARFITAIKPFKDAAVLFSGDAFNPSILSSATKGHHMVPALNAINIEAACYGNHDFDFGEDELKKLSKECNFPWVLTNISDSTGNPPGTAKLKHVFKKDGVRIGVFGLAEKDWIDTLSDPPEDIQYRDFIQTAEEYCEVLRAEDKCDLVIALTHMRIHNDTKLANACPGIDLILGGHDHFYKVETTDHATIIKSGMDFKMFSVITVTIDGHSPPRFEIERVDVNKAVVPDPEMLKYIEEMDEKYSVVLDKVVGYTEVDWDVRNGVVRTQETAFGNLACGLLRARYGADVCLIPGGSFRSDRVYPAGPVTARILSTIFPFIDPCVVIEVSGKKLWDALENGVSKYPQHEGRFPQMSGMRIIFDPAAPPGQRLVEVTIGDDSVPLDLDKSYTLATRHYVAEGNDGYKVLNGSKHIVSAENGSILSNIIAQALTKVEVIKVWKRKHMLVRSAIAAFRGVRPLKSSPGQKIKENDSMISHRDGLGIVVRPQIDHRVTIIGVTPIPHSGSAKRRASVVHQNGGDKNVQKRVHKAP